MSKHIVLTVTTDLNYDQRMIRIANSLTNDGYKVTLIGREKKNSTPLEKKQYQQLRLKCKFEKGKLFYLEYNWKLYRLLYDLKADLISAADLDTLLPATIIAKSKNLSLVFDAHEYFEEVPEVQNRKLVKYIWKKLGDFCIPQVDAAYTVSSNLAQIFSKKYGVNFKCIRNLPTFREKETPTNAQSYISKIKDFAGTKKVVWYQGALNEGRGIEETIDAIKLLENVVFIIAGEGDLSDYLKAKVAKEFLHDKVLFLAYVLPADLKQLTPLADVGINVIESLGLSYYYSLSNKTFDYLRAGVPALHSDFPEYRSLRNEINMGLLVRDLSVSTLKDAIQEILASNLKSQLQANQKEIAQQFSWEQEEKKLLTVYNTLLPSSSPIIP